MSFFTRLFSGKQETRTVVDANTYRTNYFQSNAVDALTGKKITLGKPELVSTLYSAVQLISNNISKLELNVYRETEHGRQVYTDHPWQKALRFNPDGRLSTSRWLQYVVTEILLDGGGYYYIDQIDYKIKALGANPEKVVLSKTDNEVYYRFKGVENWLPSKQLLFFPYLSKDGYTSISPISALRNELSIQQGAEETIKKFYENGLFQILYAEVDLEGIGQDDKHKAKEYFKNLEQQVAGSQNAFDGGVMRIPPMYKLRSIPLPDLKFLESSRFTEARILAIFNIPSYLLNVTEGQGSNYTKTEAQQLAFLNNCLSSICNLILQDLNDKLLSIEERQAGIKIDFDYEKLFEIDLESKSVYLKNLQQMGAVSPNDIRKSFNMSTVDNQFMNLHFIQSQNQAIELYPSWGNNNIQQPSTSGATAA